MKVPKKTAKAKAGSDGIPAFLLAENRPKDLQARTDARIRAYHEKNEGGGGDERQDFRKPRSMSWAEFDARQARDVEDKRLASLARIAKLRAKKGLPPPGARPEKAPAQRRGKYDPQAIISVLKPCPYKDGSAGHAVYEKYADGMTVAEFEKAAAGASGKRAPADMLRHDERKGFVKVVSKGVTIQPKLRR